MAEKVKERIVALRFPVDGSEDDLYNHLQSYSGKSGGASGRGKALIRKALGMPGAQPVPAGVDAEGVRAIVREENTRLLGQMKALIAGVNLAAPTPESSKSTFDQSTTDEV